MHSIESWVERKSLFGCLGKLIVCPNKLLPFTRREEFPPFFVKEF
jgi:hypothetical protein